MSLVPTATVTPEPTCAGTVTEVTVLNALTPLIVPVAPTVGSKLSVIVAPSTLVPVTIIAESCTEAAVPPTVTDKALGKSGLVMPEVIVEPAVGIAVAAKTAVLEAAATFFWVSV